MLLCNKEKGQIKEKIVESQRGKSFTYHVKKTKCWISSCCMIKRGCVGEYETRYVLGVAWKDVICDEKLKWRWKFQDKKKIYIFRLV